MEIRFCDRCDASIPRSDVERRVAVRENGEMLCAACRKAERGARLARFLSLPLAVVFSALAGAAIALLVLLPRIRELETAVTVTREEVRAVAAEDPGVAAELAGLREMAQTQSESFQAVADDLRGDVTEVGGAVSRVAEQVSRLAEEIRSLKAFAASEPEPALPDSVVPAAADVPDVDVDLWLDLSGDSDPGVRFSALDQLAKTDDPRIRARARDLLTDADPTVRARAAEMLGEYGERTAVLELAELLSDGNVRVRAVAHEALGKLVGPVPGYDATDPEEPREEAVKAFLDSLR